MLNLREEYTSSQPICKDDWDSPQCQCKVQWKRDYENAKKMGVTIPIPTNNYLGPFGIPYNYHTVLEKKTS